MKRKRQSRKKEKKYLIRQIIAIIAIVLFILLIFKVVGSIGKKQSSEGIMVLLENELITLENEVVLENDNIYISKTDLKNNFDENLLYIENEKEIVTTYNKHIALLKLGEEYMFVNDTPVDLVGEIKEINGDIYLPIKDLQIVYDIEVEYSSDTKTIVIDFLTKEKSKSIVLKNVKLKEKTGMFSKWIQKIDRGEYVTVIESEKKYSKIRTKEGNIGYVKTRRISEPTLLREDLIEEKQELDEETLVILKNSENTSKILDTYPKRNEIIKASYMEAISKQYKGININFKNIDDAESFCRLLIEIMPRFKEAGLIVVVTENQALDIERVSNIVDYIVKE